MVFSGHATSSHWWECGHLMECKLGRVTYFVFERKKVSVELIGAFIDSENAWEDTGYI